MDTSSKLTTLPPRSSQEAPTHSSSNFCKITLIVSSVLIAAFGISLGSAALSSAIPLSRRFAIILLVGGSTLGPLLLYLGLVKKQNYPLLDPQYVKAHNDHQKNVVQIIWKAFENNELFDNSLSSPPKGWIRDTSSTSYEINSQYFQTTCPTIDKELDTYTNQSQLALVDVIEGQASIGDSFLVHVTPLIRN